MIFYKSFSLFYWVIFSTRLTSFCTKKLVTASSNVSLIFGLSLLVASCIFNSFASIHWRLKWMSLVFQALQDVWHIFTKKSGLFAICHPVSWMANNSKLFGKSHIWLITRYPALNTNLQLKVESGLLCFCFVIGSENSCHSLNQSDAKLKTTHDLVARVFPRFW